MQQTYQKAECKKAYPSAMFTIKEMSAEDFDFAIRMTDQMMWGLTREDFQFMIDLEPGGCFVLLSDSEKIGIATTISYGHIGWFGNLMVSKNHRKEGGGSLLVEHSIDYLKSRNVQTIGLYAYTDRIPFYERLGFACDTELVVFTGEGFKSKNNSPVRQARQDKLREIISFEASCFGALRKKLLEPVLLDSDNLCLYIADDKERVQGIAVAKTHAGVAELGPLVCQQWRSDLAVDILRETFNRLEGHEITLFVPRKEDAIITMLKDSRFKESFRVVRMFHGPSVRYDCIYMAESLERG